MPEQHKAILTKANAAITRGDHEAFLSHCTDDTEWTFIGDSTLKGKDAVRQWLKTTYIEPPRFVVTNLVAEGDYLAAYGDISVKNPDGIEVRSAYCDVWRFRGGRMAELKAYVVEIGPE